MSLFSRLLGGDSPPSTLPVEPNHSRDPASPDPVSALEHEDKAARLAAIEALGVCDALFTLAGLIGGSPSPEAIRRAAQQRLAALIDSGAAAFNAIRARSTDTVALLAVAARTADPALAQQVIDGIADEQSLADLAIDGSSHVIRRHAANRLQDPALIARLLKEARGKDNNVYRILKTKRDALLAAERVAAETVARAAALCATVEHHEHQPFTEGFVSALDHYEAQWQSLQAQAPAELQQRAGAAIDRCRRVIVRHLQRTAQQAAEELTRAATLVQTGLERQELLALLGDLLVRLHEDQVPDLDVTLSTAQARWNESSARAEPTRDEQQHFDRLCEAVASMGALVAAHGTLRQQAATLTDDGIGSLQQSLVCSSLLGDEVPAAAVEARAALAARLQAQLESRQSQDLLLSQVASLLRKAQRALSAGQSRQAAGMRRSLEPKLRASPALPPRLQLQLQTFDGQLELLQDWRSFAVAPKRTELISQMEALIDSKEKPVALAKRIQQLQEEWKLISKGSTEDTGEEWQRFHEAGQKAYAPCREHFAEQAALRSANLERRAALLARLQEFADAQDWEHPDWREIARALRESRQQWRNHQPVERAANVLLQERFDTVTLALQTRLDAEYVRNAEAMSRLIGRAQTLAGMSDTRQAVDEIKRLQLEWKELGLVPQEERARLWEDFRQKCDAVYAGQRAQQAEQLAAFEANSRAAAELCGEAERLLTVSVPEMAEAARKLAELQAAFEALGTPTADASRRLRARFERAVQQFAAQVARQRADDRARVWDLVLDAAGRIRAWRLAVATDAASEEAAALLQAAQTFVSEVARWPKGVLQALQAALGSAGSPDLDANEAQLRMLCIRAELLSGSSTPPADQELRRQFQMQQLLKGLGQNRHAEEGGMEALMLEWIAVGPTTDAAYGELLPRAPRPSLR
jgi:hypothetical protein